MVFSMLVNALNYLWEDGFNCKESSDFDMCNYFYDPTHRIRI